MNALALNDQEFGLFRDLFYELAGVSLSATKKPLVVGRLSRRLRDLRLSSFSDYFRFIMEGEDQAERQILVDLLTTNETYFFREEKHFDFVRDEVVPSVNRSRPFRAWSAASSSGEEAYTLAMVLAEGLGREVDWRILGTDINHSVLAKARKGVYPIEAMNRIPRSHLVKHCLKGVGKHQGTIAIDPDIQSRIAFEQMNLNGNWMHREAFDLIFLRNVMIYFDHDTKQRLIQRLQNALRPGGYLFVGHAEGLTNINTELKLVKPSIYRR
jgi:chemotaxis protein methyltransferase CheR